MEWQCQSPRAAQPSLALGGLGTGVQTPPDSQPRALTEEKSGICVTPWGAWDFIHPP